MQDKWMADEDWVRHIHNQDELKVFFTCESFNLKKLSICKQWIRVSRKEEAILSEQEEDRST
jgi:hypothetical protein